VTQPLAPYAAPGAHATPRGRVPGWLWPVVCCLALLLGVVGGVVGGAVFERVSNGGDGLFAGGLDDVDTVSEAPLPADNGSVAASCSRAPSRSPRGTTGSRVARPARASCSTGRAT
jgi:putative serine protease PepD